MSDYKHLIAITLEAIQELNINLIELRKTIKKQNEIMIKASPSRSVNDEAS